jgi:hypothetical protein
MKDWKFYALISGSVLAAGLLVALLVGGEVAGPRLAQLQSHHAQKR